MTRLFLLLLLFCLFSWMISSCSREVQGVAPEQIANDFFLKNTQLKKRGVQLSLVSTRTVENAIRYVVGLAKESKNEDMRQWEMEYVRSGSEWVLGSIKEIPCSGKSCESELISKATNMLVKLRDYSSAMVLSNAGFHRYIKNGEQKAEVVLIVRKTGRSESERIKLIFREESGVFVFNGAYLESLGDYRQIQAQ
ncbi:MAG TPA: hypothetical protein PLD82_00395 [Spirochaetota bacterium]|nr:hypothetical protein [Spirochaetota bacterium]HPH01706.1 hypothetical protein [Spirochaetota bacterium]